MRASLTRSRVNPLNEAQARSSRKPTAGRPAKSIAARISTALSVSRVPQSHGYSREKFLALQAYTDGTPLWRVAGVILATPVPGLIGALLPSFVPLQNPFAPVSDNPGYLVNIFIICFVVQIGTMMHWRAASAFPPHSYTSCQLCLVSLVASSFQWCVVTAVSFLWRFPIPLSWFVGSIITAPVLGLGHLLVFRKRCLEDSEFLNGMKLYAPALLFQCIQIVLYPAFSVLFDNVSSVYQVLLTLAFPLIKYFMKQGLRRYTHQLKDFSTEVAVTGIEICASLYQSMILQNAPSQVALIIIMVLDVLQGLVAVKFFMDRPTEIPQNQIVRQTLDVLSGSIAVSQVESRHKSRIEVMPRPENRERDDEREPAESVTVSRQAEAIHSSAASQALQLVAIAESILLVEYLEVAIPLLNTLFVAISCHFSNAQYNPRLRKLYFNPPAHRAALNAMLLYSLLQALSFVAMHFVMRYRYGLSAVYHLAFILEYHWQSIVGKMIAWLPIILHFTVVHFGVDFSFRFDFAAVLRDADRD